MKIAPDPGGRGFMAGLVDRYIGNVTTTHLEIMLSQPNGVIAGSTANIQSPTGLNWPAGHHLDQVEIRPVQLPGCVSHLISIDEPLSHVSASRPAKF